MKKLKIATMVLVALCAASAIVLSGAEASAQSKFPSKPINLMIPFPPGGWFDAISRPMAEYASRKLGQPVVPVNKPGGAGTLVLSLIKGMAPDGYNLTVGTNSMFTLPPQQEVNFDPAKDFTYICRTLDSPLGIAVKADSPFRTLKDLVEYARANPGKIKCGTASPRGALGFNMTIIGKKENLQWELVPFAGGQQVVSALLGGHVQVIMQGAEWKPHVEAGTVRLLAIAGDKRSNFFPNVPCTGELGYDYTIAPANILGPAGMSKEIVNLLDTTFKESLSDPGTIKMMNEFTVSAVYMNSVEMTRWAKEQIEFYNKFIKEIGAAKP